MSDEGVPTVRRHAAVIVTCTIALFVGLLVLHGVSGMMADNKRAEVLRAWAGTLGSLEEVLELYPARESNETAARVEEFSAALGIDMAPERVEGHTRPTDQAEKAYRGTRLAVGNFLDEQFESGGPSPEPPPAAVVGFLREHAATLAGLKEVLDDGDSPRWQLQLEKPYSMPLPNLRGHVDLQRLLMADALIRDAAADFSGALAALEASWQLNAALRDEPVLVSQGIALGVARTQLGTLRHIEQLPPRWRERILEHDYRQSTLTSLRYEGWIWMTLFDQASYAIADAPWSGLILRVARPYVGYCAADVSDSWRRLLIRFSELTSICDSAPEDVGVGPELDVPSWNLVGGQLLPGLGDVAQRLARYELDREMTVKLLEIRAARAALGSSWPVSLPGIEESTVCPGDHWIYAVTPQGGMSLTLSRPVDWGELSGATLSTRYVVPAPAAGDAPRARAPIAGKVRATPPGN